MREGVGLELGDDLLDDGVPAVDLVGLDRAQGGVGDERVVAVGGEQLTLGAAVTGGGLQPPHPAHHQPARHVLGLAAPGEGHEVDLGDLGVGDPPALVGVEHGLRVADRGPRPGVHASGSMPAIAERTVAVIGAVTENRTR